MVSWWETVKVEPINALGVWVVNSSPKDFLKALSLMVSHALSCPVLAACLACYTAEPLGVSYVLEQWSAPLMVDFFCLDQLSVLNKAFPAPYTWICPNLTGKVGRNLLGRKVPLIFNEINHSSLSLSCSLSSAEESLALRSFLWLIQISESRHSVLWRLPAQEWEELSHEYTFLLLCCIVLKPSWQSGASWAIITSDSQCCLESILKCQA